MLYKNQYKLIFRNVVVWGKKCKNLIGTWESIGLTCVFSVVAAALKEQNKTDS